MESEQFREEANTLVDRSVDQFLSLMSQREGWEDLGEEEGVRKGQMLSEAGIQMVRATGNLHHSVEKVCTFLLDHTKKKKWDDPLLETYPVRSFSERFKIMYELYDCPWPVSNRDLVRAFKVIDREDGVIIASRSIDAGVPEKDGVVRAEVITYGFYLKRIGDNITELTFLACVDPKGMIPNFLINSMAAKQCDNVNKIRKAIA